MYLIIDAGIEIDRYPTREDAEQAIADLYLAGRWDDYVARLVEAPVWVERVSL